MTEREPYYRPDLAFVHHAGFAGHVQNTQRGILARLQAHGMQPGQRVLDVAVTRPAANSK